MKDGCCISFRNFCWHSSSSSQKCQWEWLMFMAVGLQKSPEWTQPWQHECTQTCGTCFAQGMDFFFFYCISINHYFAVATLTSPGVCCWCGVTVHLEEPSPGLKRWLCWHMHCIQVQEQTHCTEEAIYSRRNGIMRMRGWKPKPENSNMKWDTHVQLWGWYALAKHNLVSLVQGELGEM